MRRLAQTIKGAVHIAIVALHNKDGIRREIVKQCLELGGVYIKFLQMLAVHHSTKGLVADISNRLAFEEVPYEPIDIEKVLQQAGSYATVASVEMTPFAAGSYGQVYRARLHDSTEVIIKVLRPSVQRTMKTDLRVLGWVAFILQFIAARSFVDIRSTYYEFARATRRETDYVREAESGEWLREYFAHNGSLVIPRSFPELSSEHVLVQEYIGGISLAEAMDRQRAGERIDILVYDEIGSNIWEQLFVMGRDFLSATLRAEYLMADPHPGNIRLLANNQVALIDFGLVAKAPTNRGAFADLIGEFLHLYRDEFEPGSFAMAMLAFYDTELYSALRRVASELDQDYSDSLRELIQRKVSLLQNDTRFQYYVNDRQVTKLFTEILTDNNSLGIKLDEANILLQRSMGVHLSVMRAIGEQHDGSVHFKLMEAILSDVHDYSVKHGLQQPATVHMSSETAYEVLANWLTVVAERDKNLYNQILERSFA